MPVYNYVRMSLEPACLGTEPWQTMEYVVHSLPSYYIACYTVVAT